MKHNNRKNTWKAIVAVMLVMATLFSISTMVSAEFVEELFEEICDTMKTSSSVECKHTPQKGERDYSWICQHGGYTYTTLTTCSKCGKKMFYGGNSTPCPQGICQRP